MVNVFLYCSYSGSAVGYQKAVVDEGTKTVRSPQSGEIPKLITQIWTHGGAHAAAGLSGGIAYFLIKRMNYQNAHKQRDEQGRKVFMNCAFTGDDRTEIQQLANGFLSCYQAAVQKLGGLLVTDNSEVGYTIQDFDGLHELLSSCIEAGRQNRTSWVGVPDSAVSFIALEGEWTYFTTQNGIPASPRPKKMMESKTYQRVIQDSRTEFSSLTAEPDPPPPKQPDMLQQPVDTPPVPVTRTLPTEEELSAKERPLVEETEGDAPPVPVTRTLPTEGKLSAKEKPFMKETEVDAPPVPVTKTLPTKEKPIAEETKAVASKAAPKSPVPPPSHDDKALKELEKRVTDTFHREFAEEKERAEASQRNQEEWNARMEKGAKQQGVWIKAALALAAAGILLTLVLHGLGGGQ